MLEQRTLEAAIWSSAEQKVHMKPAITTFTQRKPTYGNHFTTAIDSSALTQRGKEWVMENKAVYRRKNKKLSMDNSSIPKILDTRLPSDHF